MLHLSRSGQQMRRRYLGCSERSLGMIVPGLQIDLRKILLHRSVWSVSNVQVEMLESLLKGK
jgi:hypothetical protein